MTGADNDPSALSGRRPAKNLLRAVVVGCCMVAWVLVTDLDLRAVWAAVLALPPVFAGLSLVSSLIGLYLHALRWRTLLAALEPEATITSFALFRRTLAGNFFGLFVPSSLGADAAYGFLTRDVYQRPADSWAVVGLARALGATSLIIVAGPAAQLSGASTVPAVAGVPLVALVALFAAVGLPMWGSRVFRMAPERLRSWTTLDRALDNRSRYFAALLLSVVNAVAVAASYVVLVVGLAPGVSIWGAAAAALIAQFAHLVPSWFGLGAGQVALVVLLGGVGVDPEVAMAAAMVKWALGTTEALVGGLLFALGWTR